jgi:hypothetical protein
MPTATSMSERRKTEPTYVCDKCGFVSNLRGVASHAARLNHPMVFKKVSGLLWGELCEKRRAVHLKPKTRGKILPGEVSQDKITIKVRGER